MGSVKPLNLIFNRGPVSTGGSNDTVNVAGYRLGIFSQKVVPSQRHIMDLGDWTQSRWQHTTGQSGQPFHKHYGDMVASWRAVDHHVMLYEKDDIEANKQALLILEP